MSTFKQNDYEVVNREVLYQGIFRLARYTIRHRLFKGGWSETFVREVLERYSAAGILPYDPILDRVILIEQFRAGSIADPEGPWQLEIPAGVISKNEAPDELAKREALEEAGCEILDLHPISGYFASPGAANEYVYLFCGRVDARTIEGVHGLAEEHEDIRVINIPLDEALELFYQGKIKTTPAIITLLWLQIHRKSLQQLWGIME